jgi:hypothetical protein
MCAVAQLHSAEALLLGSGSALGGAGFVLVTWGVVGAALDDDGGSSDAPPSVTGDRGSATSGACALEALEHLVDGKATTRFVSVASAPLHPRVRRHDAIRASLKGSAAVVCLDVSGRARKARHSRE